MKATDLAAWWGAIVASLILIWDIYKWKRSGPIVRVSASPNMRTYGNISDSQKDKTYVVVEVTNTGDRKTTITHLIGFHYKSFFQKILKKRNKAFVVAIPALSEPLPYVLEPGERWLGGIDQNNKLEEISQNGFLYCGVYHSSGKRPVLERVIIKGDKVT